MSKTKVSFKLDSLKQKIKGVAKELQQDKFGNTIKDEIVRKVRQDAFRFKTGKKFKRLKKNTIERRKQLAKYNKTHPE